MKFQSNLDFIEYIKKFQDGLIKSGNKLASDEIEEGMSCLNGLTDGWALLLESVDLVNNKLNSNLNSAQLNELNIIRNTLHHAVYRE